MIEGAYARAGLVSDVEVVDDYPSHFSAFSRRKHRWVRGDWQIIFWLLPRVPDFAGHLSRNPLSTISRWKIIDNLRRSLTEFATFALLISGWLFLPGRAIYWTLAALAIFFLPTYFQFAFSIATAGAALFEKGFWKSLFRDFASAHAKLFIRLTFLCHQSLVTCDAVVRTMVRMLLTRKKMLEWETAAESETNEGAATLVDSYLDWAVFLSFAIGALVAVSHPASLAIALPFLVLWSVSKWICDWLNQPLESSVSPFKSSDRALLRNSALRTWRFFREFSNREEHWLIPDIVQADPPLVAHRVSTTNLGLLLNSRQAAHDLGYLTLDEFVHDSQETLATVDRMEKHRGHLYNWYDNRTLEPVKPLFVSTVDNGNLLCSLWTLKHGALESAAAAFVRRKFVEGNSRSCRAPPRAGGEEAAHSRFLPRGRRSEAALRGAPIERHGMDQRAAHFGSRRRDSRGKSRRLRIAARDSLVGQRVFGARGQPGAHGREPRAVAGSRVRAHLEKAR